MWLVFFLFCECLVFLFYILCCNNVRVRGIEEEKEDSQRMNAVSEENMEEKGGKKGGPKKLFKWNEEIRLDIFKI